MRGAIGKLLAAAVAALVPAAATASDESAKAALEPAPSESVAVLPLRSALEGADAKAVDAAALADRVRAAARLSLPEALVYSQADLEELLPAARDRAACTADCELAAAREAGAGLVVTGDVARSGPRFRVSLELHDAEAGKLLNTASASGAPGEELSGALARATLELFRPVRAAPALVAIGPARPTPPEPAGPAARHGQIDGEVLAAYERARQIEQDKEQPERAAAAWRAVAAMEGDDPLRDDAAARAKKWSAYDEDLRAFQAQLAKDADRLREVLPERWIAEPMKIDLLTRFARVYGVPAARPLAALFPDDSGRLHAELALGCEAQEASRCAALAKIADAQKDEPAALEWLDRACALGSAESCGEAGERWLSPATRDPARAIPALQRACAAQRAASCVRLARAYEEGDGVKPDAALAAELRDQACSAGDGKSCRRLACFIDAEGASADARSRALLDKGCAAGDLRSCELARKDAAAAGPLALAPAAPTAPAAATAQPRHADGTRSAGIFLVAGGALAAGAAAFIAVQGNGGDPRFGSRRFLIESERASQQRTQVLFALSAGALLSSATGVALLLSKPESPSKVAVSPGPGGLVLSGKLP